jgi:hypothetical protein
VRRLGGAPASNHRRERARERGETRPGVSSPHGEALAAVEVGEGAAEWRDVGVAELGEHGGGAC